MLIATLFCYLEPTLEPQLETDKFLILLNISLRKEARAGARAEAINTCSMKNDAAPTPALALISILCKIYILNFFSYTNKISQRMGGRSRSRNQIILIWFQNDATQAPAPPISLCLDCSK
jgi:hypothetical protein